MLTAISTVGKGKSATSGSPTASVVNGSSTIAASSQRCRTIVRVSIALNDASIRWLMSQGLAITANAIAKATNCAPTARSSADRLVNAEGRLWISSVVTSSVNATA